MPKRKRILMKKRHLFNAGRNFGFSTYEGYHHKDHFLAKNIK
ncbi:hypothetical protein HMPREF2532_04815 [Bacteroides ovatus]|nr:hypothetical protein HMPREF2532_04815 [Bacteroides ovatus]